jgi:hypothetical protein
MTSPIDELKIRARLLRNALAQFDADALRRASNVAKQRRWAIPDAWTLTLCLNVVSVEAGFNQWDHARIVLGGDARQGDDMGRFWYDKSCSMLLNHWFASYDDARGTLKTQGGRYLLPYGRQFVVVESPFIIAIGLDASSPRWAAIEHDLVRGYGTPDWRIFVQERMQHTQIPA